MYETHLEAMLAHIKAGDVSRLKTLIADCLSDASLFYYRSFLHPSHLCVCHTTGTDRGDTKLGMGVMAEAARLARLTILCSAYLTALTAGVSKPF